MRISDWSSDVCSSDLGYLRPVEIRRHQVRHIDGQFRSVAFRLHRRFSPKFRFSYRGASEGVPLDPQDLAVLCLEGATVTAMDCAANLVAKITASADIGRASCRASVC